MEAISRVTAIRLLSSSLSAFCACSALSASEVFRFLKYSTYWLKSLIPCISQLWKYLSCLSYPYRSPSAAQLFTFAEYSYVRFRRSLYESVMSTR